MKKTAALVLLFSALLFAVGFSLFHSPAGPTQGPGVDLAARLPSMVPGWEVTDLPLGATEAQSSSAQKTLGLDGFVQRKYERYDSSVTVYVAYWKPGSTDTRLAASHMPDRCWVENGWKLTGARHAEAPDFCGVRTIPAEFRTFEMGHTSLNVYYWMLVNGESYEFGDRLNSYPSPWRFVKSFLHEMARGRPEIYFVRISSDLSPEELHELPLMREIAGSLAFTGIDAAALPAASGAAGTVR